MLTKNNICFIGTLMILLVSSISPLFNDLPITAEGVDELLNNQTIDSTQWQLLRPLYVQPLSVPDGELFLLKTIFPTTFTTPFPNITDLEKYEPWNKAKIDIFYKDYPYLTQFSPILAYPDAITRRFGTVRISASIREKYNSTTQSIWFEIGKRKKLSFNGTMQVDSSTTRWGRRRITGLSDKFGEFTIGNFRPSFRNNLFLGNFNKYDKSEQNIIKNWLYGNQYGYNGITFKKTIRKKDNIELFAHVREEEQMCGINYIMQLNKQLILPIQIVGIQNYLHTDLCDTSFFITFAIEKKGGTHRFNLQTGYELMSRSIPIKFYILGVGNKWTQSMKILFIPNPCALFLSKDVRQAEYALGYSTDTINGALYGIHLSGGSSLNDYFTAKIDTEFFSLCEYFSFQSTFNLGGVKLANLYFKYRYKVRNNIQEYYHSLSLKKRCLIRDAIRINPSCIFSWDSKNKRSFENQLFIGTDLSYINVGINGRMRFCVGKLPYYRISLSHSLKITNKTHADITMQIPFTKNKIGYISSVFKWVFVL